MEANCNFFNLMQAHLEEIGKLNNPTQASLDRKNGKKLDFSIHIKYMIHAQLSNQEKWTNVLKNIDKIDNVFFKYDICKIKEKPWNFFYDNLKPLLTRGVSLEGQMQNLHLNISTMESINNEYKDGGIDSYVVSKSPREIVVNFTRNHKLKYMGVSLICEYLKNVGVECAKPDTHIMRFLSKTRRGFLSKDEACIIKKGRKKGEKKETNWSDNDKIKALKIIEEIGKKCGKTASDIDRIIWSYCADNYGEICTKSPKCYICVVKDGCNHIESGVKF